LPVAGKADRFKAVGINTPKPMIEVCGKPIIEWALSSIADLDTYSIIFMCQKRECDEYGLDLELVGKFGSDIKIIMIDKMTGGALETCTFASDIINNHEPLVIYTPDAMFIPPFDIRRVPPYCAGWLSLYPSIKASCSYAKIHGNEVIGVAEKKVISPYATTGLYYFREGCDFLNHAMNMIACDDRTNGEFYIAPLYNRIIESGQYVGYEMVHTVDVLGTPEEVRDFERKCNQEPN